MVTCSYIYMIFLLAPARKRFVISCFFFSISFSLLFENKQKVRRIDYQLVDLWYWKMREDLFPELLWFWWCCIIDLVKIIRPRNLVSNYWNLYFEYDDSLIGMIHLWSCKSSVQWKYKNAYFSSIRTKLCDWLVYIYFVFELCFIRVYITHYDNYSQQYYVISWDR